jgi:basic membrane protein A
MRRCLSWMFAAVAAASLAFAGAGTTAESKLRVGLVLQTLGTQDPYDYPALRGFNRAVRSLGVEGRVVIASPSRGALPSIAYLARQKYDLVIGYGYLIVRAMDTAALQFPKTKFAIIDASQKDLPHKPKNVRGGMFAAEQPSYLAGYLAALMEKRRPGKDAVGAVGGYRIPTVDHFIAGYQAGARRAAPRVATLTGYAGSFVNLAKCKAVALRQIARGAGVVFQVASSCGLGALDAAREQGVWAIGVDIDQSSLGPHVLTSALKRLDVGVFATVSALQRGTFRTGGDAVFDLRSGGVGLGKISRKVPRSFVREVERIRAQIIAGKIVVPARLR